jgi:hypothetical protein
VKNVFDEWKIFCGFDTNQSIVDFSKDESFMKNLVDIMSFFVVSCKKDRSLYPPTRYVFIPFFEFHVVYLCKYVFEFKFLLHLPKP